MCCRCLATSLALTPNNPPPPNPLLWQPTKSSEMAKILWRVGKEEKFTPAWKSQIQILLQIILPQYFFDDSFQAPKALQVLFSPGLAPLESQVDNPLLARTSGLLALKSVLSHFSICLKIPLLELVCESGYRFLLWADSIKTQLLLAWKKPKPWLSSIT